MTPSLGIGFSAAADGRLLTIDEDCVLISCSLEAAAAGTRAILSKNPKATIANSVTAPSDQPDETLIAAPHPGQAIDMAFPLSAGQSVFASASAACLLIIQLQLNR